MEVQYNKVGKDFQYLSDDSNIIRLDELFRNDISILLIGISISLLIFIYEIIYFNFVDIYKTFEDSVIVL